ncbi:FadR/GntR family transcriptional regulator [Pseudohoeflea suaedae]|uniref:FadR/GntR family transcriptional regulator n=1 Tax=Pseudohoeflea suaedae TaxID=877384 RepID=UPI001FCE8573|nr:FadR/GntR family transcriptional regulator [Pseudohoeflea suaedae]
MLKTSISTGAIRNSHALVVDEIGRSIISGAYPTGSLVPGDTELAERFNVSRTVLREAMKTLAAKGLVIAKARIGTRVTEAKKWNFFDSDVLRWHLDSGFDAEFMRHLSDMRLSFEPSAARLATLNATPQDIAAMKQCVHSMYVARTMEEFALADLSLHMAMIDAARNPFMYSVASLIEAALVTSFRLSSPMGDPRGQQRTSHRHQIIVEAIEAGDGDAAARATEVVIIEGRDRLFETDEAGDLSSL